MPNPGRHGLRTAALALPTALLCTVLAGCGSDARPGYVAVAGATERVTPAAPEGGVEYQPLPGRNTATAAVSATTSPAPTSAGTTGSADGTAGATTTGTTTGGTAGGTAGGTSTSGGTGDSGAGGTGTSGTSGSTGTSTGGSSTGGSTGSGGSGTSGGPGGTGGSTASGGTTGSSGGSGGTAGDTGGAGGTTGSSTTGGTGGTGSMGGTGTTGGIGGTGGTGDPGGTTPAHLTLGTPHRSDTDDRWCEHVTIGFRNTGGRPARSGTVTFATHVIGALGIDWATITSAQPLPAPISAGTLKRHTYLVCVEAWRVPLGMHIETQEVTATWK
ncbi:hypothetical protein [Streptomyces sp. NPDC093225]|uniref:hypothetical protein n=1 Tax=Streptomyces sp. NPDC093225 TaxID=3366034 RepID=UPI00382AADDC